MRVRSHRLGSGRHNGVVDRPPNPAPQRLRVGELARLSGLTVRALHHYEEIGLLEPQRTASGHRVYSGADLARLQRIRALQLLGLSLLEVRAALDDPTFEPLAMLGRQLEALEERAREIAALTARLERLRGALGDRGEVSPVEFQEAMEAIAMFETYYTPEQLATLQKRAEELGPDGVAAARAQWARLIASVREKMEAGVEASHPDVLALATRWQELVAGFTSGDSGIRSALADLLGSEPDLRAEWGLDPELMAYIGRAQR